VIVFGAMEEKGYVTIRLADADRERLERLAVEAERSLSAEIRLAIREHLRNNPQTAPDLRAAV
jgi:predicted transcriptional regulator